MAAAPLVHLVPAPRRFAAGERIRPADGEAFIHLCPVDEVAGVRARFYADRPLIALVVDERACDGEVRWEDTYGHGAFPHLYGELVVDAALTQVLVAPEEDPARAITAALA